MKTKMNNKVKALLMACCAVLLVFASVLGTLAYLTDTKTVTNTFTVGNVQIKLDEAQVDPATGKKVDPEVRISGPQATNSYKILPGRTIDKDPTVSVKSGSENCYVRMLVTVDGLDALKAAFPQQKYADWYLTDGTFLLQNLVKDSQNASTWDPKWECIEVTNDTYEFRYADIVDTANFHDTDNDEFVELPALFKNVTVPGAMTNEEYANLQNVKIIIEAHAIQVEGFENDVEAAWTAFDAQQTIEAAETTVAP